MNKFTAISSILAAASKYLVSLGRLISASSLLLTKYFLIFVFGCLRFQIVLKVQAVSQTAGSSTSSSTFHSSLSAASACRPWCRLLNSSLNPPPSLAWQRMRAWERFSLNPSSIQINVLCLLHWVCFTIPQIQILECKYKCSKVRCKDNKQRMPLGGLFSFWFLIHQSWNLLQIFLSSFGF